MKNVFRSEEFTILFIFIIVMGVLNSNCLTVFTAGVWTFQTINCQNFGIFIINPELSQMITSRSLY